MVGTCLCFDNFGFHQCNERRTSVACAKDFSCQKSGNVCSAVVYLSFILSSSVPSFVAELLKVSGF